MPSGDTMAAAYFVSLYFWLFHCSPLAFLIVVMAGFGRVYVHCHWFGDCIVGGVLGTACGYLLFSPGFFRILVNPLTLSN